MRACGCNDMGPHSKTCSLKQPVPVREDPTELYDSDTPDPVNHPAHYTNHPSGVECIEVTEHLNFCIGNAVKYLWRAGEKGNYVQDLEKAAWYIAREIARVSK